MPIAVLASANVLLSTLLTPKSPTFSRPSSDRKTFAVLKSLSSNQKQCLYHHVALSSELSWNCTEDQDTAIIDFTGSTAQIG